MQILAHRGFWKDKSEKNTIKAIERAFTSGFGIETDIRDYRGNLIVSHDIGDDDSLDAETVFKLYKDVGKDLTLALNVKADGIQKLVLKLIQKYDISNYFLFDMSIPELVVNSNVNIKFYTRSSDIECHLVEEKKADGIWLDSFYDKDFIKEKVNGINVELLERKVCIVSPELHGWKYEDVWEIIKQNNLHNSEKVQLCTDYPDIAKEFFYGED